MHLPNCLVCCSSCSIRHVHKLMYTKLSVCAQQSQCPRPKQLLCIHLRNADDSIYKDTKQSKADLMHSGSGPNGCTKATWLHPPADELREQPPPLLPRC